MSQPQPPPFPSPLAVIPAQTGISYSHEFPQIWNTENGAVMQYERFHRGLLVHVDRPVEIHITDNNGIALVVCDDPAPQSDTDDSAS